MTRKDYVLIAEVLRNQAFISKIDFELLVEDFADALAKENPRFDRDRFLVASGYSVGCSVCGAKMRYVTGQGEWCADHLPDWAKKIQHQISAIG